jgi:hypothetical protein
VCAQLREVPELKNGYNAIGFSQGGQFIRVGAGVLMAHYYVGLHSHGFIHCAAHHIQALGGVGSNRFMLCHTYMRASSPDSVPLHKTL